MVTSLQTRNRSLELMDQVDIDVADHREALKGLERINAISGTGRVVWKQIRRLSQRENRPLRVLDLACGGGDLLIWLSKKAERSGVDLECTGCDISPVAIAHASESAQKLKTKNLDFRSRNVLEGTIPQGYDIVLSTLFLHHLDQADAISFLHRAAQAARCGLLIDDLLRTHMGYALAWIGCRLLSRSHVVHYDGPVSVQGAFSLEELRSLLNDAGLHSATVTRHWPKRFLVTWWRS
ncbi:MAG: methyltransferase domain-containing protein [Pirellulales bacterium]